jgi:hypothetical protein
MSGERAPPTRKNSAQRHRGPLCAVRSAPLFFGHTVQGTESSSGGCDDCHRSFPDVIMAPVLHDHIWQRLARQDETLCGECMFERAVEQRIRPTLADLLPCPFNLFHSPLSWFEFFAKDELTPPKNLAEWGEALQWFSPRLLQWLRPKPGTEFDGVEP